MMLFLLRPLKFISSCLLLSLLSSCWAAEQMHYGWSAASGFIWLSIASSFAAIGATYLMVRAGRRVLFDKREWTN
jgi:hypothetical protein